MSTIGSISQATIAQHIENLPHYNTNDFRDLPKDAAAEGVFANGDVYGNAYALLTPSDTALVESITGEQSVIGDPLALAIGIDRGFAGVGSRGGLSGDVTTSYLASVEAAVANPTSNGTYQGFQISPKELNDAIGYLNSNHENQDPTPTVSVSA